MNFQDNGQLGDCACGPCCVHPRGPVLAMCCLRDPRARVAMWPCFGSPSGPEGCDTGLIFSHPPPLSRSGRKAPSPRDPGLPGGVCSRCLLHGSLGPREGGSGQDIVKSQIKKKKSTEVPTPNLMELKASGRHLFTPGALARGCTFWSSFCSPKTNTWTSSDQIWVLRMGSGHGYFKSSLSDSSGS